MATAGTNQNPRVPTPSGVSTLIALALAVQIVVGAAAVEARFARDVCVERQSVRRISAGFVRVIRDLTAREAPAVRQGTAVARAWGVRPVVDLFPPAELAARPAPPAPWLLDLPPPAC